MRDDARRVIGNSNGATRFGWRIESKRLEGYIGQPRIVDLRSIAVSVVLVDRGMGKGDEGCTRSDYHNISKSWYPGARHARHKSCFRARIARSNWRRPGRRARR